MKNSSSSFKIRVRSILEECKHFLLYLSICRFPVLNCTITLHNHTGFVLTYMKLYTKWWHTVIRLCCILWDCLDLKFWCLNVPITDKFKCPVPYGFRTQEGQCAAMKIWDQILVWFGAMPHRCWDVLDRLPAVLDVLKRSSYVSIESSSGLCKQEAYQSTWCRAEYQLRHGINISSQ